MPLIRKIKQTLAALFLSVVLSIVGGSVFASTASAYSWGDFGEDIGDLFETGEQGLSFTEYEGQLAQLGTEGYAQALTASTDLREFIITIVNFALGFLGLLAVIIVIYGGVLYVAAGGEEERTQTGKKAITYAVIGLLIVLGSFAFVNTVIKGATGGSDTTGTSFEATGAVSGGGFNAAAEQVRALAVQIFSGFLFLEESTEELKNIRNDALKESLIPENLPDKNDVLNFLHSVKLRLSNMKSRILPFSEAESRINDLLRDAEREIDAIDRLNRKKYAKLGSISYCDVDDARGFWEGLSSASDKEICGNSGYKYYYTVGLYEAWKPLHEKYTAADTSGGSETNLYDLIRPIADNFAGELEASFLQLEEIFGRFQNIQAIQGENSRANVAYSNMKSGSAYGYSISGGSLSSLGSGGGLAKINQWTLNSSVSEAGGLFLNGLQNQAILYEELKNLQFVQARLTADVVEGSAPLPVIFDTLGTVDPAGGSVNGNNITWDLSGKLSTSAFITEGNGITIAAMDGSVDCTFAPSGRNEEEFIGDTAKRCIYNKPGTYTAAVKIESNEPSKYAPGISVLTVKVRPPTTRIELSLEAGGETHTVMHYINDVLATDRSVVKVTESDARAGIVFDASATDAERFKWDFGDGTVMEFSTNGREEHEYGEPGKYEVKLEVISALGVIDRKIFSLEVTSIAARLDVNPPSGAFVNTPVVFDAGRSKSDLGQIVSYKWKIEPTPGQNIPPQVQAELDRIYPLEDSGGNLKKLTHEFKYPINYNITIEVADDARNRDDFTIQAYRIESQEPVALFDFTVQDDTQPATLHFDALASYDPDGEKNFNYQWSIEPATGWQEIAPASNGLDSRKPIIKFNTLGDYDVTLRVTDQIAPDEFDQITKTVTVDNILDVSWDDDQEVTFILDDNGIVEVDFEIESENAVAYEIDFGDGEKDSGEMGDSITHIYSEGGTYLVRVTVYDDEDNDNSIQRRFFISGGDNPIAKITLFVNDVEIQDLSQPVRVSKTDVITLDAGESQNTDGTGRNLKYSWNFGDGRNNSKKSVDHSYADLSPRNPGYYLVTLKVTDDSDVTKNDEDEVKIDVINIPPRFSSVQGIVSVPSGEPITPVPVEVRVYGAEDPDGRITRYKWWYFDVTSRNEPLGVQITDRDTAQLTIGTRGGQGEQKTYGFALEIMDSDGLTFSNMDDPAGGPISELTVTNGPNEMPTASFNVDSTFVFAGDEVNFTSSSNDPDGSIVSYIWDLEGDGFHNNDPTTEPSIEHVYTARNQEGYNVRLKVRDDKGGEAVSEAVKIYVDSKAEPPVAAFNYEVMPGGGGMRVKFINNSRPDEDAGANLLKTEWDFDTSVDADGDGVTDNDLQSPAESPEFTYNGAGTYEVRLFIADDQGNTDDVTNSVRIPLASPPVAAFSYSIVDGQVVFVNNSVPDLATGAQIVNYIWDFDTGSALVNADSNGDGLKDNDEDSNLRDPVKRYTEAGTYNVKLTIADDYGNTDEVINPVQFTLTSGSGLGGELGGGDGGDGGGGSGGGGTTPPELLAALVTEPAPADDGVIYLDGDSGTVRFNFSRSTGAIAYYIIDKNIYFDTSGDGTKNNDEDFKTSLPGTWTTNFEAEWGRIVLKLTVRDIYGNENSTTVEIKFESP